jgi:hypothetical protein
LCHHSYVQHKFKKKTPIKSNLFLPDHHVLNTSVKVAAMRDVRGRVIAFKPLTLSSKYMIKHFLLLIPDSSPVHQNTTTAINVFFISFTFLPSVNSRLHFSPSSYSFGLDLTFLLLIYIYTLRCTSKQHTLQRIQRVSA